MDVDQAITLTANPTGGSPPYSYQWYWSSSPGTCGPADALGSGPTQSTGAEITIPATYYYCVVVTDSASNNSTSLPDAVSASSMLTAPSPPTVSATTLNVDQGLTVTGVIPSTGTPPYSWQWLVSTNGGIGVDATQCSVDHGSGAGAGDTKTCNIVGGTLIVGDSYAFDLQVTDSAQTPETTTSSTSPTVTVHSALSAGSPTPTAPIVDSGQSITLTANPSGGTMPYGYQWYSGTTANDCMGLGSPISGATISTFSASPSTTTYYCYAITDSATDSGTSTADQVTANSALTAPAPPTTSATILDLDQGLIVAGTIPSSGTPSYSWQWLVSTNGGAAVDATQCSVDHGSGASPGVTKSCNIAGGLLTVGDTYQFELQVTDGASAPETGTSSTSPTVTVSSALTAPGTPSPNPTSLDADQPLTVTGKIPSTGSPAYSWQWLISVNGGASADATECAANSGTGASGGATETCAVAANTLTAGDTYTFELQVTDSATSPETQISPKSPTVMVSSLLSGGSPTPSSPTIDSGQVITLATNPSGGSTPYTYQWYSGSTAAGCTGLGSAISGATALAYAASPTVTTYYCYTVTDAVSDLATSGADRLTVNSLLTAPSAPTVSATTLDINQPLTVNGNIPTTGTSTYSWQWRVSVGGGSYADATQCGGTANGNGATGGASETCTIPGGTLSASTSYAFELRVTDSAFNPETATSSPSPIVTTSSALTAGLVSPSSPVIDNGQSIQLSSDPSGGTTPYSYQWYSGSSASSCTGLGSAISGATSSTYTASPTSSIYYCYVVTDADSNSATSGGDRVVVNSALSAPSAPTMSAVTLDVNQELTGTGTIPSTGTPSYSWQWLISTDGGAYVDATQCSVNSGAGAGTGVTERCSIVAGTLTGGHSYALELKVTDSASAPESKTSSPSPGVMVQTALTAPAAPTPSATALDVNQALTTTGTIPSTGTPSYSWQWLVSVNGGSYAAAMHCAVGSGTEASGGATEACSIAANSLTTGDRYAFELKVTDGASTPETQTSSASSTVTVHSALTAPAAPTPSATALDANQPLTVKGTIPTTGAPTYAWQWLISINGNAYADATQCGASASGSGATAGASETCTIPGGTLTASSSYTFELEVTDGASTPEIQTSPASSTVATSSALTAGTPTPTSPAIDSGQSVTLSTNPSGGTSPYSYQWYSSGTGTGACSSGTPLGTGVTQLASPTATTYYCYTVTDSAHAPVTQGSAWDKLAVNSALTAPAAPTVNATSLEVNQQLVVTGVIPSSGTPTYSWLWLVSVDGGAFVDATQCVQNSGSGAGAGDAETCQVLAGTLSAGTAYVFELKVSDSATLPETQTSTASPTVTLISSLTAPSAPVASASTLDVDQGLTVTGVIPSTGTPSYSWQWLVSIDGGSYVPATECAVDSGSGASGGATETCGIAAGVLTTGDTYAFELNVTDSASLAETATSPASSAVAVASSLAAPVAPVPSVASLETNQTLTVTGTIPSTGTPKYSWQWLVSVDGGTFVPATQCGTSASGGGATGGATETCTVPANTLVSGDSYVFELQVSDSATTPEGATSPASSTVSASSPLTAGAPTPTSPTIDSGQSITLAASPSGGSGSYTYQWYSGSTASACTALGSPISGATLSTYVASPTATTYYCYVLTDPPLGGSGPESVSSSSVLVTVNSALSVPSAPTVSATTLKANQGLTLSEPIPSTGTPSYSWQWLVSVNRGAYLDATECTVNDGSGAAAGVTETCTIEAGMLTSGDTYSFELQVTDSATSPYTQTSAATPAVTVTSAGTVTTSSSFPWIWVYIGIALATLAGVVLVTLVALRWRRLDAQAASTSQTWEEGPAPPRGGRPAESAPAYLETREDIGSIPPTNPTAQVAKAAAPSPVPTPVVGDTGSEVDSILAELDKISAEISSRSPRKVSSAKPDEEGPEDRVP